MLSGILFQNTIFACGSILARVEREGNIKIPANLRINTSVIAYGSGFYFQTFQGNLEGGAYIKIYWN